MTGSIWPRRELELRQDEVDDAKQDLIRAGGDPQDRIQAMVQEHEAASQVLRHHEGGRQRSRPNHTV